MLNDPEFLAAATRAREEINAQLHTELCRHGERKFDDSGAPTPCPKCREASAERAQGFWHKAKDYMDGVKTHEETGMPGPKNTAFAETPGFPEPKDPEEASS